MNFTVQGRFSFYLFSYDMTSKYDFMLETMVKINYYYEFIFQLDLDRDKW